MVRELRPRRGRLHRPRGRRRAPAPTTRWPTSSSASRSTRASACRCSRGDAASACRSWPTTPGPCGRRCAAAGCSSRTRPGARGRARRAISWPTAPAPGRARHPGAGHAGDPAGRLRGAPAGAAGARPGAPGREDRPMGPGAAPRRRHRGLGPADAGRVPVLGPRGRRLRPRASTPTSRATAGASRSGAPGRSRRRRDPPLRSALAAHRGPPRAPRAPRAAPPQHHAPRVLRRAGTTRWSASATSGARQLAEPRGPTSTSALARQRVQPARSSRRSAFDAHRGPAHLPRLRPLPRASQPGAAAGAGRRPHNLLFVGRVAPNKRHDDLIRLASYWKRFISPDVRLLLVGKLPRRRAYFDALQALLYEEGFTPCGGRLHRPRRPRRPAGRATPPPTSSSP